MNNEEIVKKFKGKKKNNPITKPDIREITEFREDGSKRPTFGDLVRETKEKYFYSNYDLEKITGVDAAYLYRIQKDGYRGASKFKFVLQIMDRLHLDWEEVCDVFNEDPRVLKQSGYDKNLTTMIDQYIDGYENEVTALLEEITRVQKDKELLKRIAMYKEVLEFVLHPEENAMQNYLDIVKKLKEMRDEQIERRKEAKKEELIQKATESLKEV